MNDIARSVTSKEQGAVCNAILAPYASQPSQTKGRFHKEEESIRRGPYERDRDRIIHSRAFRRLKHKTQVFIYNEGDHYRTRLTHSLEVAQVARSLARSLRLNEDLAEAIALSHDLGHTPFAHLGEHVLQECLQERNGSWFNHNEQTFRIVTKLEKQYLDFDGLNLTWECLEGIAKHNGPVKKDSKHPLHSIIDFSKQFDLKLELYPSAEAQIADVADGIAYNNHDLDDGLRAKFFTLDELADNLDFAKRIIDKVRKNYPEASEKRMRPQIIRELMGEMVDDIIANTLRNLEKLNPKSADDIRNYGASITGFSPEFDMRDKALRKFLGDRMYFSAEVNRTRFKMGQVVKDLFSIFMDNAECLPNSWQERIKAEGHEIVVLDYIAGMTDKFALDEHRRLFDPYTTD